MVLALLLAAVCGSNEPEPGYAPPPLLSADDEPLSPPPLLDSEGVPVTGDRERVVPHQDFVKGELSMFLGSDRLATKRSRVGASLGVDQVGLTLFALVEPQVDLRLLDRKLAIGVGAPLRFEVVDLELAAAGQPQRRSGEFQAQDYDEVRDFAKVLKFITYGRKEDRVYLNVGQRYASSIGHGPIVRRYAPNIDVDVARVSAQLDAYNDYAGFELLTNDVMEWNLLAGLAFLKPLSFFSDSVAGKSLSIGLTAAADLSAPRRLLTDPATSTRQLDGSGRLIATRAPVVLAGIDAEVKVVKTREVDIKPYVDYSLLLDGDGGLTVGALGRFNTGDQVVHAFRVVAELRYLGRRYQPSYFDTFYEVERYIAAEGPRVNEQIQYLTKYQDVTSGSRPERLGYYVEGSWGIRGNVGFTLSLEGATSIEEKNLVAHLEVPAVDFLQFFGSYYKRGFKNLSEVGSLDARTIIVAGGRLKLLPFLFVNGHAFHTFRMDKALRRYENTFGWAVNGEIGYEFDVKREGGEQG
ncbi:MAG: hypothetical protein HYZ28_01360 [Myxococcales bacterium]|nr:hypothetical protein [Myxococcales bacterium]